MYFVRAAFLLMAAASIPAWAQTTTWDTSGNYLLKGAYYFRDIVYVVGNNQGFLNQQTAIFGTITFDGVGGYKVSNATVNSCKINTGCAQQTGFSITSNYWFGSNGHGFLISLVSTSANINRIYGLIAASGVLIGSSTEAGFNSLFVAAPVGTPATTSSFQGAYQMYGFIPGALANNTATADFSFTLSPDGAGNLGNVNITGYSFASGTSAITQSSPGVTYSFTNGAGQITFPTSATANFYSGDVVLYLSPDHNFVFGGAAGGLDMVVGVKPATGNVNFSGLYYQAGIDVDASQLASQGFTATDTYYGTVNAVNGTIFGHKRIYTPLFNPIPEAFTYRSAYPATIYNGTYTEPFFRKQYTLGNGGAIRIGIGAGTLLGINITLKAPVLTGSGVFLNPNGVVNAADFSPFTQGISGGEIIALYGTGLSSGNATASSLPLPTVLGNVQVMINGILAPLFYVTPTQLTAVVPFGIYYTPPSGVPAIPKRPIATIQVINNGVGSNTAYRFVNLTSPGLFTLNGNENASGFGYALIEHAQTGQVVNESNPAQPGEPVSVFISGLGDTFPVVTNGAAPTGLSNTVQPISAWVGGVPATVIFAGLAPTLAGVYQVNLIIPVAASPGDNVLEIFGTDSHSETSLIPVGGTTNSAITGAQPRVRTISGDRARMPVPTLHPPTLCFATDPACGGGIKE